LTGVVHWHDVRVLELSRDPGLRIELREVTVLIFHQVEGLERDLSAKIAVEDEFHPPLPAFSEGRDPAIAGWEREGYGGVRAFGGWLDHEISRAAYERTDQIL
jgi:hypothetical protein